MTGEPTTAWAQVQALLPRGMALPRATADARHSFVLWVLAGHVAALPVLGLAQDWPLAFVASEVALVAGLALAASVDGLSPRLRATVASVALVLCSAILIQFSGGRIEAHFHVFIALALVSLYQDWVPLSVGVAATFVFHGAAGLLAPHWLFDHAGGAAEPWKWILVHAVAILGQVGALLAFWSGAEQARARSALVLDSTEDAVVGVDSAGNVTFANPAASSLLGRAEKHLVGQDVRTFLPACDGHLGDGGANHTPSPQRGHLRGANGNWQPVEWTITPAAQPIPGIDAVLVLRDVAARELLEQALAERSRQQETVARLGRRALESHELALVLDAAAREVADTLGLDFAVVEQLGEDRRSLVLRAGIGWQERLADGRNSILSDHPAGHAVLSAAPVAVEDFAGQTRFQVPAALRSLGIRSALAVAIPGREQPWGVLTVYARLPRAFSADAVTFLQATATLLATAIERQAMEDELRAHRIDLEAMVSRRTAQLTEANRELEAFSYTVSHDLRSPLRALDGFSRILLQRHEGDLPEESRRMLRMLGDGATRMGQLIDSVLSLARLSRVPMAKQSLDLGAVGEGILRDLALRHPDRAVAWTVQPGMVAYGDPGLMQVALENLLSNAWKFTAGTSSPHIVFTCRSVNGHATFVVEDNGAGFDMEHARELFQPFTRLHSPAQFEGTGIGLATVKRIVQRHGGTIWAQATVGHGARLSFTLGPDQPEPMAAHAAEAEAIVGFKSRSRTTVSAGPSTAAGGSPRSPANEIPI